MDTYRTAVGMKSSLLLLGIDLTCAHILSGVICPDGAIKGPSTRQARLQEMMPLIACLSR